MKSNKQFHFIEDNKMKTILDVGTVLRVKPNFNLSSGEFVEPSTKFVIVISVSKVGTPKVMPLGGDTEPILPIGEAVHTNDKNMHWSKEGWNVYGHNTEIYIKH